MSRDRGERNARQPKANGELKASLCLDSKNEGGKLSGRKPLSLPGLALLATPRTDALNGRTMDLDAVFGN